MPRHTLGLHIFRRDLRLHDNTALLRALSECEQVLPVFIFDPRQANPNKNPYFSAPAFAFMIESLCELDADLEKKGSRLYVLEGEPEKVIAKLIRDDGVQAIYVNRDYTPFARARDASIENVCSKAHVPFTACDDLALSPITTLVTQQGKPYSVFTPFVRNAMTHEVPTPKRNARVNYYRDHLNTPCTPLRDVDLNEATKPRSAGGRKAGLTLLKNTSLITHYKHARDLPAHAGTSHLSPHHKFGTVSIRETYEVARTHHGEGALQFVAELYWRDFYYHIAHHFPHVFGKSFLPWGDHIAWHNDPAALTAWQIGETGIPIVDAGMRELNTTGWMHNRVRMIVASFLTKNLLIDWRAGEKYFAQTLIDYDPAVNNGGWQWSASVGADPRPLRIFNPYTQARKYDLQAEYIARWVPELRDLPAHLLVDGKERDFSTLTPAYPAPIVSCRESYHRARGVWANAKRETRQMSV